VKKIENIGIGFKKLISVALLVTIAQVICVVIMPFRYRSLLSYT